MVGKSGQRCAVGFGRADVHVDEYLRRIETDDFDGKAFGNRQCQIGLAASGRADQAEGGGKSVAQ